MGEPGPAIRLAGGRGMGEPGPAIRLAGGRGMGEPGPAIRLAGGKGIGEPGPAANIVVAEMRSKATNPTFRTFNEPVRMDTSPSGR
jgi:hypothetical protein